MKFQVTSLQFISDELNTTTVCPACPKVRLYFCPIIMIRSFQTKGYQVVSLFGLCRKRSAGLLLTMSLLIRQMKRLCILQLVLQVIIIPFAVS